MKKLLLVFIVLAVNAYAQSEPKNYKTAITRFQQYYNLNQPDSIFSMFSPDVRVALPEVKNQQMISQLQSQLGRLQQISFMNFDKGVATYKADFTKSVLAMKVSLNDKDQLGGLLFDNYTSPSEAAKAAAALKLLNVDPSMGESAYTMKGLSGSIAGTLTMPENASGKVPLVLIVAGAGTDRNGNNNSPVFKLNTNAYKELAIALRQSGIASLRYDKRMIGESHNSNKEDQLRLEDHIEDAMGLINKLHDDERFSKVIVLGHGEGSLVGMIASEETPVSGVISVEGAAQPAYYLLKQQAKEQPDYISTRYLKLIDSLAKTGKIQKDVDASLYPFIRPSIQTYLLSWMRYSPFRELKKLKVPVLLVQGSTDLLIKPEEGDKLKKSKTDATLVVIPNMNYVLKEAPADRDKNLETYTQPDLPLKPELAPAIVSFINKLK